MLNDDYPKWVVAFLQKCCDKWQPRKCLGLNVAKLFIYISKNGQKTQLFLLFPFSQKIWSSCENSPKNN